MHFKTQGQLERFRLSVREFVRGELETVAEKIEKTGRIPKELFTVLQERGILGLTVPPKYGGRGLSVPEWFPILEEIAWSHGTIRMLCHGWNGIYFRGIYQYGTEEHKKKYLPLIARGEWFAGFALTEPEGGTGADIHTTAVRKRGAYIINGQKHLISFADISQAFNITARTGEGEITAFLVARDAPGLTIKAMPEGMGMRGSFHGVLTFRDCRIPATEVLGEVGKGLDLHLDLLDLSRGSIAVSCVGLAQHFLELAADYAKKRVTFQRPLASRQAIQWMLADMATQIYAGRLMARDIAQRFDQGLPIRKEAAMAKLFGIEMLRRVSDQALEIYGGIGYTKTSPLERMYRDARAPWLEEGPPTIQRLVIARETLKEF